MADDSGFFVVPAFVAAVLSELSQLTQSNIDSGP